MINLHLLAATETEFEIEREAVKKGGQGKGNPNGTVTKT